MRWIAEQDGLCLYYELSDTLLGRIREDGLYYRDEAFTQELFKSSGDNCHIILLINNGDTGRILRHLKRLLREYKTVSFWNRQQQRFRICSRLSDFAMTQ